MVTQAFKNEVYAEQTGQAFLTLLSVDHPDLSEPLRFTSDGVATVSQSDVYTPLAFQAQMPDRAAGRQPQARLRLDNVNSQLVAALRGLQEFPTVDIYIVRASALDVREVEYTGLEVVGMDVSASAIELTLAQQDLAAVPFPARNFDGSWRGIWDT